MGFFRRRSEPEDRTLSRERTSWPDFGPLLFEGDLGPSESMRIADVFACVRCLADAAASLPLIPYRRLEDGNRERFSGRLADLIARPAPATTSANLIGTTVAHLNLHGDAFLGKYRDDDGTVVQLGNLDPTGVEVEIREGRPLYTLMRPSGVSEHGVEDVLHIRALSTDGIRGLSPIRQARQAVGLASNLTTHADSFAKNSGRLGGVLRLAGWRAGQPQEGERTRTDWDEKFGTPDKSGGVLIVGGEGDVQFTPLTLSMADAQFVEQRNLSTQEVARIFRVPPWMIGAPTGDSLTYSTVEGQALAFVKFSLAPWLTLIEQAISADPDLSPSPVFVEFLLDGLLRAESKTRAEVYALALDPEKGWLRRDEVRRLENLPPEEGSNASE
jgi:HK97 family phage portal protein